MLYNSRPFSVFPYSSQLLTGSGGKIRIPLTLATSLVIIFMEDAEGIELQITG